jgi:putative nucleotidyltransferase with HDIG domain
MSPLRPAPRLLVKTLAVTFTTVTLLLVIVFVVVMVSVRDEIRRDVATDLRSGERIFAALEMRRDRELRAHAAMLAENPLLKAALDRYDVKTSTSDGAARAQLLAKIDSELKTVSEHVESDVVAVADAHQKTLAVVGRLADRWPQGQAVSNLGGLQRDAFDGIVRTNGTVFRVVAVPLLSGNVGLGTLYLATSLDQPYADELAGLAGTQTAIIVDRRLLVSTLSPEAASQFGVAIAATQSIDGTMDLAGESHAFRQLMDVGNASIYALGSIDASSRPATQHVLRLIAVIALGATALAFGASLWLARMVSEPVGQLSASIAAMAAAHDLNGRLVATRSSRELDRLTDTFNALMASVATAEAETEAAYAGAIRSFATALDARDPYTAGHSERVSALSVAIGRALGLPAQDVEVLRLGALLHDIGKIGVPDDVLRKPGALTASEFNVIKTHPVLGARILRSVPFLAPHLPIVELHHERPDGRGYPRGLRGDHIPLHARIVHVADAYDAMTSTRAYRNARSSGEALGELWRCAGTEFHVAIVGALATVLPAVPCENADLAGQKSPP